jgi:photosystem II stability/assembly factor-like uncharacterized protein
VKQQKYIIFILTFYTALLFPQVWQDQSINRDVNLFSIKFADSLNGWVIGDSGVVLKTTDGGSFWNEVNVIPPDKRLIRMQIIDSNHIYILTAASVEGASFYLTSDGGDSWVEERINIENLYPTGFHFVNPDSGYIIGLNGKMFRTENTMRDWDEIIDPANAFPYLSVYFQDFNTGWVTGGRIDIIGFIKKTTDAGVTWQNCLLAIEPLNNLYFINEDTAFAVGGDPEYGGWIYLSTDEGITWELQEVPAGVITLQSINYFNKNLGWAGGAGSILNSTDFGETWNLIRSEQVFVEDIATYNGKTFWFVGSSGFLNKYEDTTTVVVSYYREEKENSSNNSFSVFPNPTNSSINLTFYLEERKEVEIYLYDSRGRKIKRAAGGVYQQGEQLIKLHLNNLPSGNYFLKLKTENSIEVKKIILIK